MKALPINVYKHGNYDCTNNGISSRYSELLLIHPEGFIEIDESNPPENLVKIVERKLAGKVYKHIEPVAEPKGAGWMSGGNIGYSCDSRFADMSEYPLSIHDRQESWEMYNSMD